jgi:hypothetical membrane protein
VTGRRRGFDRLAASAGIVGASVIALGSVVTAAVYRGADGQPYNPFHQFVSELGELRQSQLAGVFNLSLIVGGVCFALFMSGLAASRPGRLRLLAGAVGVAAGAGGSFVGVFPMDHLAQHSLAAMTFFNLGWIAVGLASLDFVVRRDPRFPRWLAVVGLATVVAFLAFLRELGANTTASGRLATPTVRPEVWALPTLEWLSIIGIVGWVLLVGATWLRVGSGAAASIAPEPRPDRPAYQRADERIGDRALERPAFQPAADGTPSRPTERPAFQPAADTPPDRWSERPAFEAPSDGHR